MKTSSENIKEAIPLLKVYNRVTKVDFSIIHKTSEELAEALQEDPYKIKPVKNINDIVRQYKALYIGALAGMDNYDNTFKIKGSDKCIEMKATGELKTIFKGTINSEEDLAKLIDTDEFMRVLELVHPVKINEYIDALMYTYRMYSLMFNAKLVESKARVQVKNGRAFIYYKDNTKFDITKELKFAMSNETNISTGGMKALINEHKELFRESELKYEQGEKESCISFNTGWDKEIKEEHHVLLSVLTFPEIIALIDTLFVKYGVHDIVTKYLMEEIVTNIMYHNFRVEKTTDIEIKNNLIVLYGDSKESK